MTTDNLLSQLFPTAADIPEKYRLNGRIEQREYLVDGTLQIWPGPLAQVRSPVYLAVTTLMNKLSSAALRCWMPAPP